MLYGCDKKLGFVNVYRANGITQNQLAKELGIENNNFFYIVKNLECRGLIVKQPVVVKTKEAASGGNSASVTNILYLYRYAKHLGCQQRFEINKDDAEESDVLGNGDGDNVLVRDFLPAMKAVCDKLEEANDKVGFFCLFIGMFWLSCELMFCVCADFSVLLLKGSCCFRC